MVDFWNPTIANLSLMALGSSAPEILLSCIETISGLGKCPGELGASTIVGSAAFNLLVISGVSIYAVNEENDDADDKDENGVLGVKKINDMGVFAITCTSSLWAYIWLFICVSNNQIDGWEAWLTLIQFLILLIFAFGADKYNEKKQDRKTAYLQNSPPAIEFTPIEIYRELILEKKGQALRDTDSKVKRTKMKNFLKETFGTTEIE